MAFAEQHDVRGCDSVQLAAALIIHTQRSSLALSPLIFVSADTKLNAAARAEGLAVEDPNNYP